MTHAFALVPLWDRAAEWERRLTMIATARSFLYLTTFYLEYDAYGIELLAALRAAQQRGVAVVLVVDAFGQRLGGVLMSRDQRVALAGELQLLRDGGAGVHVYAPPHWTQRLLGGGQHVKIQVSDGGEAIFGSSNLTKSSFAGWNEYAVAVRGPVAAVLLASVRVLGGPVSAEHLAALERVSLKDAADLALDYWVCNPNLEQGWRGPLRWAGANEVTERMIEMLDAARTSARITSFYFKPVPRLLDAVLRAAARGLHVEVFHSHRDALPATDLAWIAAASCYPALLDAGVAIYENRRGEHSKLVVVDDAWAAFGSYNFEDAAHDRLAEAMLASRDPRAVTPLLAIFAALRVDPDNERVTAAACAAWPARVRTRVSRYGRFKWWM
ncbi:MAG: phosphatidylserine/phosphatidylglycerophosphate/cardiolipin synthase family protein [Acidobacteriota bacterium]